MAIACEAANGPSLYSCQQPVAIKLDLVHPALGVRGYLLDQCGELRQQRLGENSLDGT